MIRRPARGEPGLDVLRGVLVIGMFAVHTRRLQPGGTQVGTLGDRALDFLMWSEPFIAAGFLFVVGTSLVLSHQSHTQAGTGSWPKKVARRAAWLYALSMALFVPQYGLELPDMLVSSGILSVIAIAIAIVGAALATARPGAVLAAIATAGVLVTAWLDHARITLPGVNAGPGGALPLISFSAVGAIAALLTARYGRAALVFHALVSLVVLGAVLAGGERWITERASYYAEHAGLLALPDLLAGGAQRRAPITFWNHSAFGALGLSAPLSLFLLAFIGAPRALMAARALSPLALLGRHALVAYVGHLGVLGVLTLIGFVPASALGTWALVFALVLASLAAGLLLDRRAQSAPASTGAAAAQTRTS